MKNRKIKKFVKKNINNLKIVMADLLPTTPG